ncbi:MAG: lytic murein transglycosylase [Streptosporangiaceae bacterium]
MLIRLRYAALSVVVVAFGAGVPAAIATGAVKVGYTQASRPAATLVLPSAAAAPQAGGVPAGSAPQSPPRQLIVPDLFAVLPAGITAAQVNAISGLTGVRAVLAVDGGQVVINGRAASLLGVPPAFRSWTPPATAAATGIWARLSGGQLIASGAAAGRLGLAAGHSYLVSAGSSAQVRFGAADLGIPGVDAIVTSGLAARLGLAADVAVLINAPAADLGSLMRQVQDILGAGAKVVSLVPVVTAASLPVDDTIPAGRPSNWLQLYQDSAAEYCPGLSWTVLAAIGEIESGDGANDGPSTAGALGPMQFLPSTWRIWGTDGFGQTGPPDIMNPLDAVPSAARMLCADGAAQGGAAQGGAAQGGAALSAAIFDYNHAAWYVSEVLALAGEYAQEYP